MEARRQARRKAAAQRSRAHEHNARLGVPDIVLHAGGIGVRPVIPQLGIIVYGDLAHAVMPQLLGIAAHALADKHRLDLEARHMGRKLARLANQLQPHRMQPAAADLGIDENVVPLGFIDRINLGFKLQNRLLRTALYADAADLAGRIELRLSACHINRTEGTIPLALSAARAFPFQNRNLCHASSLLYTNFHFLSRSWSLSAHPSPSQISCSVSLAGGKMRSTCVGLPARP